MVYSEEEVGNLGLTKQRSIVLQVIHNSADHLTANEVFDLAKKDSPGISFATVYNSLRYLKEYGHIAEINFGNGASRYDRTTSRHDHAICTKCDRLIDLNLNIPEELIQMAARRSRFMPESIELTLRGLCPDCKNLDTLGSKN